MLVFHINYYVSGILHEFETSKLEIHDKYSFDIPPISSEEEWTNLIQVFLANAEKLASLIEQMNDEDLDQPFIDGIYGAVLRNVDGLIEHAYYHLGQITLIKKMIKTSH